MVRKLIAIGVFALLGACNSGTVSEVGCTDVCGTSGGACLGDKCVCPAWFTACGTSCVDLATDPAHCGACGTSCGDGFVCEQSKCSATCALTVCPGAPCVDTKANPAHCGSCDNACGASETCKDGACERVTTPDAGGSTPPPPPPPPCGGANLAVDPKNCGECGHVCPASASGCSAGVCVCPTPWTYCRPDNGCWNLGKAHDHCGSCSVACGPNETCCVSAGGGCVNTLWSENHCGACGKACGTGKKCCKGGCIAASNPCPK